MRSAERFVRGLGRFSADIAMPGELVLRAVRSPHAAARILGIDVAAAGAVPGVQIVLTGADYEADGWRAPKVDFDAHLKGLLQPVGEIHFVPNRFMPKDAVHYQGEIVAIVLATTAAAAESGVELVDVSYEPLPACVTLDQATAPDAQPVWDVAPDNIAARVEYGSPEAVQRIFETAAHVVADSISISRVIANPMEPRVAIGEYRDGRYILHTNSQMPNEAQRMLAEEVIGVSLSQVRVVSPDVGGGFGSRAPLYPEMAIILWAAQRCGRPVRWVSERSEGFLSDVHARDWRSQAEMALDASGRILAYRVATHANIGAYPGQKGPMAPFVFGPSVASSVYSIPAIHLDIRAVYSNTVGMFPYRGAGAPETNHVLEQMLDKAARQIGIDRAQIRRLNLIDAHQMPYRSPVGVTYDSGDYATVMQQALEASGWSSFEKRREESRLAGKRRGIGIANFMKSAGGQPVEWGALAILPDGMVEVRTGTRGHGQSHDVVIPRLVASSLGVEEESVRLVEGDTDLVKTGRGTHGSRSMMMVSNIVARNSGTIIDQALKIAAALFNTTSDRLTYNSGVVSSVDSNEAITLTEMAQELSRRPIAGIEALSADLVFVNKQASYPSGTHIAEVEVDEETGELSLLSLIAVEDIGNVLDRKIATAQAQGGLTQGVGQALFEQCVYDEGSGQLLSGSFMDYTMPRAASLPNYDIRFHEVPSPTNPAGVKGLGENGPIGALPAVISALVDALAPLGVTHVPMPATPQRLWSLIRQARAQSPE